jgi:methanethiol S-methyltransferase
MKRWLFFIYGVACYLLFLGTFAYMAGFVGGFWVPKTIDTPSTLPLAGAIAVNLLLIGMFAVQHSVMARPAFKRLWTRIVPQPVERSTYVLASCAATIVLMIGWQGMEFTVWDVEEPRARIALWILFAIGWLLVPVVTLLINHFDLFGLRQVWLHLQGRKYKSLKFRIPLFYKHVRHPLYIGWAMAFWVTPTMTLGHMLFASVLTIYMVGAAVIEERDLIAHFGEQYREYRRRVPMFVPRIRKSAKMESGLGIVSVRSENQNAPAH